MCDVCVCDVCVCVLLLDWEGMLVFASTALVLLPVVLVVWMAMYLTGYASYSDYLTGVHEPLLTPYYSYKLYSYRCHTGLKNV